MQTTLTIVGIVISILGLISIWPEIKKYVPFLPRPLLQIDYQEQDNTVTVFFENIGNAPASYFTSSISTIDGVFTVGDIFADFNLSSSGKGGSWTVLSGRNILPNQTGSVTLIKNDSLKLNAPKVKSDSRHKFIGTIKITIGPEQSLSD